MPCPMLFLQKCKISPDFDEGVVGVQAVKGFEFKVMKYKAICLMMKIRGYIYFI